MDAFRSALWAETLKAIRSKVPLFTALGFAMIPAMGGFFMIILKDPAAARSMGLISTKAQITAGSADWPAFFGLLSQATAAAGAFIFSIVASWVFGREYSDRTVKDILALPTSREIIVSAKFVVVALWCCLLTLILIGLGFVVGKLVDIPGWSAALAGSSVIKIAGAALLTLLVLPYVAFIASAGRGYLAPFGWIILTIALAQIAAFTGWGDWFPWAIPLMSSATGPREGGLGPHSYVVMIAAGTIGLAMTYGWWRDADQTR